MHPAGLNVADLLNDCQVRRQRRSGPGGQHRNKVETAVVITHVPSGLRGEASERRSQEQNRQKALFRLRVNLALQIRVADVSRYPSTLWQQRCVNGRVLINGSHSDFPALLAEALDVLQSCGTDVRTAAGQLQCSASQLVKFLRIEPRALQLVNETRQTHGLSALR